MKNTKRAKAPKAGGRASIVPEIPEFEDMRIVERPDGYYWQSLDGRSERGPFASRLEAELDLEIYDEDTLEVGETLEEAEAEIGIAEWVDPETGEPAEEDVSRIEEH